MARTAIRPWTSKTPWRTGLRNRRRGFLLGEVSLRPSGNRYFRNRTQRAYSAPSSGMGSVIAPPARRRARRQRHNQMLRRRGREYRQCRGSCRHRCEKVGAPSGRNMRRTTACQWRVNLSASSCIVHAKLARTCKVQNRKSLYFMGIFEFRHNAARTPGRVFRFGKPNKSNASGNQSTLRRQW